jgi:choline dehydrogenase-like flavoprotein
VNAVVVGSGAGGGVVFSELARAGLSVVCLACHAKHGQTTRASCAACHPRLSNCGRDVETMDTTFKDPESRNDVHRVACGDCHPKGVRARKTELRRRAGTAGG